MKRLLSLILVLLLTVSLFAGCSKPDDSGTATTLPPAPETQGPGPETAPPETDPPAPAGELALPVPEGVTASEDNARVFYEIFVGSFSDSDGDGIGDLRGIINRMDYLNDGDETSGKSLGIEGIWLTPIYPSNSYHKYDCNDFYNVDKSFGTTDDLRELAEICHQRNVKLILDLAINHTSRSHPWFNAFVQAHRQGNTDDPYYEYYTYYTEGESAPAGRAFSKLSGTDIYYECNFYDGMPELNFDNEEVRQAVLDVAKFWLDLGVDGFRFDAAKYVYYGEHQKSVDFWVWYMDQLRAIKPDLYTVAEVWDGDGITDQYFAALNCFNFSMAMTEGMIASTAQKGDVNRFANYVESYLNKIGGKNPDAMICPFIANHDNDRAAGFLPGFNGFAQMAANLLILGPGSPFLYYGEELGLRGSRGSANTDANRRLAMPWGDEDTVKDPEGTTYPAENRSDGTAVEQMAKEGSLYSYYKKVILLRKANPEIARGTYTALKLSDTKVGGFISEWNGGKCCVLHNTTGNDVTLDLNQIGLSDFSRISGFVGMGEAKLEGTNLTLASQTSVVLR